MLAAPGKPCGGGANHDDEPLPPEPDEWLPEVAALVGVSEGVEGVEPSGTRGDEA